MRWVFLVTLVTLISIRISGAAVELVSFSAYAGHYRVLLQWETASETDNSQFMIARRHEVEHDWDTTFVEATNNPTGDSYDWLDTDVVIEDLYSYLLYSVDTIGNQEFLGSTQATPMFFPVELAGYDAIAGDGYVELHWVTSFEDSIDRFEIDRNGELIASVEAANSDSGHAYVWIDSSVVNTFHYTYALYALMLSGDRIELATVAAIPREEWPGELTYFGSLLNGHTIHLYWETYSESPELNRFEIDRDGETVLSTPAGYPNGHWYQWPDSNLTIGVEYTYLLSAVDDTERRYGLSTLVLTLQGPVAVNERPDVPVEFEFGNYPNPFNNTTTLRYELPSAAHVTLSIYNIEGRQVATLVNEVMTAGEHSILWSADAQASGIYFATLRSGDVTKSVKLVYLK